MASDPATARNHLANERTFLAWVRTSIAVMGLGFVVAKFELIVKSLVPSAPTTGYDLSSIIGVALVMAGGLMQLLALSRFTTTQQRIRTGIYEPSKSIETTLALSMFVIALVLAVYLVLTV